MCLNRVVMYQRYLSTMSWGRKEVSVPCKCISRKRKEVGVPDDAEADACDEVIC